MFLLYNVYLRTIYYFFNRFYFSVAAMFRFLSSFNLNVEVIAAKCKTTKHIHSALLGGFCEFVCSELYIKVCKDDLLMNKNYFFSLQQAQNLSIYHQFGCSHISV